MKVKCTVFKSFPPFAAVILVKIWHWVHVCFLLNAVVCSCRV